MQFYNSKSTSQVIKCCDNWAAISQINKTLQKYSRHCKISDDVDIISHILDWIKASPLHHCLNWVKAHQDDKCLYQELDIWGCMNCNANKIATRLCAQMDRGEVMPIREGYFTLSSKVWLSVCQREAHDLSLSTLYFLSYSGQQTPYIPSIQTRLGQ